MELIKLQHNHFKIHISTQNIAKAFNKAAMRYKDINMATVYNCTDAIEEVSIWSPTDDGLMPYEIGTPHHPVIFENKDYSLFIQFENGIEQGKVYSRNREISTIFSHQKIGDIEALFGTINFGNDLGKFDLTITYIIGDRPKDCTFQFEVLPIKLDLKTDYRVIVQDIEQAYPQLALALLKKTYSHFHPVEGYPNDLIWWSIFSNIYARITKNIHTICNQPHNRLVNKTITVHRKKIKNISPLLAEELHRYKDRHRHYYHVPEKRLSTDTYENRFVKFALKEISVKFHKISKYIGEHIKIKSKLSDQYITELTDLGQTLKKLKHASFFNEIGEFEGIKQESLVLQRKHGYSALWQDYLLLRKSYRLFDSIQKIGLKDVSKLYQVWCFLKIKSFLDELLGTHYGQATLTEIEIDNLFVNLKENSKSRISYITDKGNLITLYQEFEYNSAFNKNTFNGSYTVDQRPDIVLTIQKNDLIDNQVFTYLFDVKYRLDSDDNDTRPDLPPKDAINQMHRYRDAIYYENRDTKQKAKEVIGGYILFPGKGSAHSFKKEPLYQSIEKINIGAFPLLPGDQYASSSLLKEHLAYIIGINSVNILEEVPPQKGKTYAMDNTGVFIGLIKREAHIDYLINKEAEVLHFHKMPKLNGTGLVKYFAPYVEGEGISCYYEILRNEVLPRNRVYPPEHVLYSSKTDDCFVFHLRNKVVFNNSFKLSSGVVHNIRYTTILNLRNPENNMIVPINSKDLLGYHLTDEE